MLKKNIQQNVLEMSSQKKYENTVFLRLLTFKLLKPWIRRKFLENATSNPNTGKVCLSISKAVVMKRIGWNVMAGTIKLTGKIPCCATNENAKDKKLDILVMFALKSSVARQILWDIDTYSHTSDPYKCDYCQKNTSVETISRLIKNCLPKGPLCQKKEMFYLWTKWKSCNQNVKKNKLAMYPQLS